MNILRTIGWLIAIVYATIPSYWLLVHPLIRHWRTRGARLSRVGPLWMLLWVIAGFITWHWRQVALYASAWAWVPAGAFIFAGIYCYAGARKSFSTDQVLGRSELEPGHHEQRLVAQGLRAHVRHPYYLGHFCELLGWSVGTGLAVCYALLGFAVVTGIFMIRAEERELVARFGESYRQYQGNVPAFFPKF